MNFDPVPFEKLLKSHRIRRIGAAKVLAILKQTALTVAPGVTEAAVSHIRVLIESIRLCAKQLKEAHWQLDRLCKLLAGIASENGSKPAVAGIWSVVVRHRRDAEIADICQSEAPQPGEAQTHDGNTSVSGRKAYKSCPTFIRPAINEHIAERRRDPAFQPGHKERFERAKRLLDC